MFSIEWWNGKHGSHLNTVVVHYTQHIIGQSIFKIGSFCSPFSLIQNVSIQCKEHSYHDNCGCLLSELWTQTLWSFTLALLLSEMVRACSLNCASISISTRSLWPPPSSLRPCTEKRPPSPLGWAPFVVLLIRYIICKIAYWAIRQMWRINKYRVSSKTVCTCSLFVNCASHAGPIIK